MTTHPSSRHAIHGRTGLARVFDRLLHRRAARRTATLLAVVLPAAGLVAGIAGVAGAAVAPTATLFVDYSFKGASRSLVPGAYDLTLGQGAPVGATAASSLVVPAGLSVTLCGAAQTCQVYPAGSYATLAPNDSATYATVSYAAGAAPAGLPAGGTLFVDGGQAGASLTLPSGGSVDLFRDPSPIGNDQLSSVLVQPGNVALVCADSSVGAPGNAGRCTLFGPGRSDMPAGVNDVASFVVIAPSGAAALSSTSTIPVVLTAGGADARSAGVAVYDPSSSPSWGQYYWVNTFRLPSDFLTWNITSDAATSYTVVALVNAPSPTQLTVTDTVGGVVQGRASAATNSYGWDRLTLGSVTVPAGASQLTLNRSNLGEMEIKSLELVPTALVGAVAADVAATRANGQWLTDGGYGLFFQYGAWGYPRTGPAKSLLQQSCDFDVPRFVSMVQSTGARWVIWSYTWFSYTVDGGNPAIDAIMGGPNGRTLTGKTCPDGSSADLNLKVAQALRAAGIRFLLYYHMGHDNPDWWDLQRYPAGYSQTGLGDKSTFLSNWKSVVTYIGNQFGTLLDGFWFDDGNMYYPTDFKALMTAARVGNPGRLVTWNNWLAAPLTPYQDFMATDNGASSCINYGDAQAGWPVGADGVFTSGPGAGIRAHCVLMLNQDWGVHDPNQPINLMTSTAAVQARLAAAKANHTAMSLNLMMWEDGSIDPATLALLQSLKATSGTTYGSTCTLVDDSSASIAYSPGWSPSSSRGVGDVGDGVRYTTTAGATATYTFTGSQARLLGPLQQGASSATITLRDASGATVESATASENTAGGYQAARPLYVSTPLPVGTYTLTVTNAGTGAWLQVDAIQVLGGTQGATGTCTVVNDGDPGVAYSAGWARSGGRSALDVARDVHYSTTSGNSVSYTFTGRQVQVVGPTEPGSSSGSVTVTDRSGTVVDSGSFTESAGSGYAAGRALFVSRTLAPATYTVTVTNAGGGSYLQVDAFTVMSW